tara:strand:- start:1192 stop:2985 length:1794 start_codon:yes stop_codon:yes gene_type:complete
MWTNVLKSPYRQPFQRGAEKIDGKLVGQHPLPLLGAYEAYLTQLLDNNHRNSIEKWWLQGRLKTRKVMPEQEYFGVENAPKEQLEVDDIIGLNNMKAFYDYRQQMQPPTWEDFVSKIDEKDEIEAARVMFTAFPKAGRLFPEELLDAPEITQDEFEEKAEKVYREAHYLFSELITKIEDKLSNYLNSEYVKNQSNPRQRAQSFLIEVINDLAPSRTRKYKLTKSPRGLTFTFTPNWEIEEVGILKGIEHSFKFQMNLSQTPGDFCMQEFRNGKFYKTMCLGADSSSREQPLGDLYAGIVMFLLQDTFKKYVQAMQEFAGLGGSIGRDESRARRAKNISWNLDRLDVLGRRMVENIKKVIADTSQKFQRWGRYFYEESGGKIEYSVMKSDWADVLKNQRKVRQPRVQTTVVDVSDRKRNLLPKWVQNNTTYETRSGVRAQYNTLTEMFRINTDKDKMLLAAWYLRSYIARIDGRFQRNLKEKNPFAPKGPSIAPMQVVPIKTMTGKLLSYVLIKYNKKIPEINFIRIKGKATDFPKLEVMDLGNGSPELNWENNVQAKDYFRKVFGPAEVGETPQQPETRTIADTVDEETRRTMRGGN